MTYIIIRKDEAYKLENEVNYKLQDGWQLRRGSTTSSRLVPTPSGKDKAEVTYYQAMVKE